MRKSRSTETQTVDIVREYDAGVSPKELARRHGYAPYPGAEKATSHPLPPGSKTSPLFYDASSGQPL
jgi:hypothetical protein